MTLSAAKKMRRAPDFAGLWIADDEERLLSIG